MIRIRMPRANAGVVVIREIASRGRAQADPPSRPEKAFLKGFVQYVLAPVVVGIVAFISGVELEEHKRISEARKFLYEQKMKVWTASAKHFSAYIANWTRLRTIAAHEKRAGRLTAEEQARKNQYVRDRDAAWEGLESALWEAMLLFGGRPEKLIQEYLAFESTQNTLRLGELAPIAEWHRHRDEIMHALREEALPR